MAHEFADAQLALRAAAARAGVVLMASTSHDRPEFSDARFDPRSIASVNEINPE
jgi:hypothetical protein